MRLRAPLVAVYSPVTLHSTEIQALSHSPAQNLTHLPFVGDLCLRRWLVRSAFDVIPETVKCPRKKKQESYSPSVFHRNFLCFLFVSMSFQYFGVLVNRLFSKGIFFHLKPKLASWIISGKFWQFSRKRKRLFPNLVSGLVSFLKVQ